MFSQVGNTVRSLFISVFSIFVIKIHVILFFVKELRRGASYVFPSKRKKKQQHIIFQ